MNITFISGFDIGRFGAIMKKTFESKFSWSCHNIIFNESYLDRPEDEKIVLNNGQKELTEVENIIKNTDFFILRWLNDDYISLLELDKYVTAKNTIYKVHGSEARIYNFPESLIHWMTKWRYLPIQIVSCMDQTVIDRISIKHIYHIERPFDFDIVPKVKTKHESENVRLFHSPTNRTFKSTEKLIEITRKIKGLELAIAENITYDECFKERAKSDAVFDQFADVIGTYGMSSVEGWALKLPVFVGLKSWAFVYHPELLDIAINVTPETLFHHLKMFIEDPKPYIKKGQKGYRYIKEVHDPEKIAIQYRALIETISRR